DSQDRIIAAAHATGSVLLDAARLTSTGGLDTSFDGDGQAHVDLDLNEFSRAAVAVDSLDRVILGGTAGRSPSISHFSAARLTEGGTLDSTFDGDGKITVALGGVIDCVSVRADSKDRVLIGGEVYDQSHELPVIRLTTSGALDSTFSGDGIAFVNGPD